MSKTIIVSVHILINQQLLSGFEAEIDTHDTKSLQNNYQLTEQQILSTARNLKDCIDLQNQKLPYNAQLQEAESKRLGCDLLSRLELDSLVFEQGFDIHVPNRQNTSLFRVRVVINYPSIL